MSERKSLKNSGTGGDRAANVVAVKGKALADAGTTGIVAQGIFEDRKVEADGKYKGSKSYRIRDAAADTIYFVNGTKVLNDQMDQLTPGDNTEVEIAYNGMLKSKAGVDFHDWEVFIRNA